jgi:transposase
MASSSNYFLNLFLDPNTSPSMHLPNKVSRAKGVKEGEKRGQYDKATDVVRRRILTAADEGDDWRTMAAANGVKISTAYNWIKKGTSTVKSRGGRVESIVKIKNEHIEALLEKLNVNPLMSLKELCTILFVEFGVSVSRQTIARHLEGRMISMKCLHYQPEAQNSITNKALRRDYVHQIMQVSVDNDSITRTCKPLKKILS